MQQKIDYSLILMFSFFLFGCKKNARELGVSSSDKNIARAQYFFYDSVLNKEALGSNGGNNLRLTTARELNWNQAFVVPGSIGNIVVCPISFKKQLFMQTNISPGVLFCLDDINQMIFFEDSQHKYHAQSMTLFADSDYLKSTKGVFSGMAYFEDWSGNSIGKFRCALGGEVYRVQQGMDTAMGNVLNLKQSDAIKETDEIISVCSQVSGYNYSADEPGDVYEWSEPPSCSNLELPEPTVGGGFPASPGSLFRMRTFFTVAVMSGTHRIQDIKSYFDCFTISSAPGVTYSVELCVDQPVPGTRQPWGWSNEGLGGSILGNNPVNVGHSFLILKENNQGNIITKNVGFYPTTTVMPAPISMSVSQGMLNDDENSGYNVSLTINNISSTQFQQILTYVSLGNNQGFSYDLSNMNCSTFALSALNMGNIHVPTTQGKWPNGQGDDPGDLGEDILQMNLGPNMTRNTVSNPHPNTGGCQQ